MSSMGLSGVLQSGGQRVIPTVDRSGRPIIRRFNRERGEYFVYRNDPSRKVKLRDLPTQRELTDPEYAALLRARDKRVAGYFPTHDDGGGDY